MNVNNSTELNEPAAGCRRLDPFLNGELAGEDAVRFEAHLPACTACREAVEQQRWINGALRSDEVIGQAAPATLLTTTTGTIAAARRKMQVRRALAGGLATAATVALIAAWQTREPIAVPGSAGGSNNQTVIQRAVTPRQSRGLEEGIASTAKNSANYAADGVATFTAGGNGIAIPIASDSSEVTVVQFYSTAEADRRARRRQELETKYRELIGG